MKCDIPLLALIILCFSDEAVGFRRLCYKPKIVHVSTDKNSFSSVQYSYFFYDTFIRRGNPFSMVIQ